MAPDPMTLRRDALAARLVEARGRRAEIGRKLDALHREIDERRTAIASLIADREALDGEASEAGARLAEIDPPAARAFADTRPPRPPRCTIALYLKGRDPVKVEVPAAMHEEAKALILRLAYEPRGLIAPCAPRSLR